MIKQTYILKVFEISRLGFFFYKKEKCCELHLSRVLQVILANKSKPLKHHIGWFFYLRRCKAQIFPVPCSTSKTAGEKEAREWQKGEALQTLSFSSSDEFIKVHWDVSTLPPSRGFWRVIWGHSPGNRGQKLLPLLLHQTSCTDDLVTWRPQVWTVHLLRQVFSHHLQIRLERSSTLFWRNHLKCPTREKLLSDTCMSS